jgi:glutaredoxin 3
MFTLARFNINRMCVFISLLVRNNSFSFFRIFEYRRVQRIPHAHGTGECSKVLSEHSEHNFQQQRNREKPLTMRATPCCAAVLVVAHLSGAQALTLAARPARVRLLAAPMMSCVEVYTMRGCPHCVTAMDFLESHSVPYTEVDVNADMLNMPTMLARTHGQHTVPQIFVDDEHIGGCSDLLRAAEAGTLVLSGQTPLPPKPTHAAYYEGVVRLLSRSAPSAVPA